MLYLGGEVLQARSEEAGGREGRREGGRESVCARERDREIERE
jgi:hypothetical protein